MIVLTLMTSTALAGAAVADPVDRLKPSRADSADVRRLKTLRAPANPCAEYGPGFGRIEGTSTCIKLGGSTSVGVGIGR